MIHIFTPDHIWRSCEVYESSFMPMDATSTYSAAGLIGLGLAAASVGC